MTGALTLTMAQVCLNFIVLELRILPQSYSSNQAHSQVCFEKKSSFTGQIKVILHGWGTQQGCKRTHRSRLESSR